MTLFVYPPISVNTTGLATEAKQDDIIAAVDGLEALLTSLDGKDFATETTLNSIGLYLSTILPSIKSDTAALTAKDFATETTTQKLRAWPYANFDYTGVNWNAGTFTETFTYKTGGAVGSTVGTIVVVYSDDTKEQTVNVSYSPGKVV